MTDPTHNSGAELQSRTTADLEAELRGSFPGGGRWAGLTYELGRRAAVDQERLSRRTYWAAVIAVIVGLAGVAATLLT